MVCDHRCYRSATAIRRNIESIPIPAFSLAFGGAEEPKSSIVPPAPPLPLLVGLAATSLDEVGAATCEVWLVATADAEMMLLVVAAGETVDEIVGLETTEVLDTVLLVVLTSVLLMVVLEGLATRLVVAAEPESPSSESEPEDPSTLGHSVPVPFETKKRPRSVFGNALDPLQSSFIILVKASRKIMHLVEQLC